MDAREHAKAAEGFPLTSEAVSHNWMEGARIGEAKKPGPQGQGKGRRAVSQDQSRQRAQGATLGVQADHQPGVVRHVVNPDTNLPPQNHTAMSNQPIGTPGNDGQSGARDPCPGWHAGGQPESLHSTWGGSPGMPARSQCGKSAPIRIGPDHRGHNTGHPIPTGCLEKHGAGLGPVIPPTTPYSTKHPLATCTTHPGPPDRGGT